MARPQPKRTVCGTGWGDQAHPGGQGEGQKEGVSRALRDYLDEGEAVLLQRVKLLLLADESAGREQRAAWVAARIHSRKVDVGSGSEDERTAVRAATVETAREMAEAALSPPPSCCRWPAASDSTSHQGEAVHPTPWITGNSGPPDCWSYGERGHVQWSCPRRLGGVAWSHERAGAAATPTGASRHESCFAPYVSHHS